nr:uncharacterized protein LOC109169324 [Ipomoea batatas]
MALRVRIHKRQRVESSQQPQQQPQRAQAQVFNTLAALERYKSWISTRDFKKERGLEIVVPEGWNWGPLLLAQPGDAFDSVVREFYSNAKDRLRRHVCIVRGVEVNFSPRAINAYYGTRDYNGDDHYHRELMPDRITVGRLNEIARSFHPEAEWNIRSGLLAHMDYTYFSPQDRGILDFIKAKLIPHSHRGNVRKDQILLAYCIKERQTIDVGVLINCSICEIASAEKKSRCFLSHPFLITELCRLAGVVINTNQEVKVQPQNFLSQQYIQSRYGQGQRPINDPGNDEDEDHGEDEPMEGAENIPQPASPEPAQNPQQFEMQEFMRRGDEVHWFVGTSMYQHNRAAQGFAPNFPPPPPWLQDPRYIPEFYRSKFLPQPPPEGDNH